jgi:hypothetical protein
MQGRAILGIVNPLRQSPDKCRLYLRAIVLAMLGALVLAGNANAEASGTAAGGTPPSAEAAPEGASAGGAEPASGGSTEGTPPVSGEPAPGEAAQGTPPVGGEPAPQETPKGAPSAPAGEHSPEEAPKAPAGGEPAPQETPKGATSGTGAEHPPEEAPKGALSAPAGEHSSEGAPAGSPSLPTPPPVILQTPATPQDAVTSGQSTREAPLALTVSLTGPFTVGGPGDGGPPTLDTGGASARAAVGMIAARRLGELSCQLSGPGGRTTHSCAAGWVVGPPVSSDSTIGFATAASLAAAATGDSPTGGGRGGSGMGNAPVSPAPGPAPGGASGSMTGGSGTALLTFLTLAGLLLLAAPRAMRRLRLSCRPWLTACFVLIPERPG